MESVESVEALHVTIDSLRHDDQDLTEDVNTGVTELKVTHDDVNASAENECFF